jgi:hypothetical protein
MYRSNEIFRINEMYELPTVFQLLTSADPVYFNSAKQLPTSIQYLNGILFYESSNGNTEYTVFISMSKSLG